MSPQVDYCSQPFSFKKPNVSYHKIRPFILGHASYPVSYKLCCTGAAAGVVHKHQTEVKRHVRTGLVILHRLHQRVVVDLHHHESTHYGFVYTYRQRHYRPQGKAMFFVQKRGGGRLRP